MSGFDIPNIRGFDKTFGMPQGPVQLREIYQSPEIKPTGDDPTEGLSIGSSKPFDGVLADSIQDVVNLRSKSKEMVRGLVMGEDVELHDVMIAGSKSEVAFNLMLEVRNKLIDAWEKLSRSMH